MIRIILLLYSLLIPSFVFAGKIIVITHKDNNKEYSYNSIKRLYSGRKISLAISDNLSIQEDFYKTILNKNMTEVKMIWGKLLFSGTGEVPKKFKKDKQVIDWILDNPNRIGYIKESSFLSEYFKKIIELNPKEDGSKK